MFGSLGLAAQLCLPAVGKRKVPPQTETFPKLIARQDWPPAIRTDRIALVDKGFACFTDDSGRLAIMDLRKAQSPRTVAEKGGLGKRIIDFTALGTRAYALVTQESPAGEAQYFLLTINLQPADAPSVVSRLQLGHFLEPTCLAASSDVIVVAGNALSGRNTLEIYSARHGRGSNPGFLSALEVDAPVNKMDIQDKKLVLLQAGHPTYIECISLLNPSAPERRGGVKIAGEFRAMARFRDQIALIGQTDQPQEYVLCLATLSPKPHVVSHTVIPNIAQVLDITSQKERFLVLTDKGSRREVVPYTLTKQLTWIVGDPVPLPAGKEASEAKIAMRDAFAYATAGWGGVDVLQNYKGEWKQIYTFTVPRLPASGVATWGDFVVLAAADLKLYEISAPDKPSLVQTADTGSTVRAIASAGSFVICLGGKSLSLRKMEKIEDELFSLEVAGQQMAYDKQSQVAYIVHGQAEKTTVTPVKVYANKLVSERPLETPGGFRRAFASHGYLVLGGLNDVTVYKVGESLAEAGSKHFENLAVRDFVLTDQHLLVTAVDRSSSGFLVILPREGKDMSQVGAVNLPHDGAALAVSKQKALSVGRSHQGKDLISVIDISSPSAPAVINSVPVVEAASALVVKDQLAIVVGRGLQILALG